MVVVVPKNFSSNYLARYKKKPTPRRSVMQEMFNLDTLSMLLGLYTFNQTPLQTNCKQIALFILKIPLCFLRKSVDFGIM